MIDIDNKIINEITEYTHAISHELKENYSINQPIFVSFKQNNNNDLMLLKLLFENQIEGNLYTKSSASNSQFNEVREKINGNVDRYGKRALNNDISIIDKYPTFWRQCVGYEDNLILYFNYSESLLQNFFGYCSYPSILSNPRSTLGSRIETLRKKIEKSNHIFAVSVSYNQESIIPQQKQTTPK